MFESKKKLGLVVGIAAVLLLLVGAVWWLLQPKWVKVVNEDIDPQANTEMLNHIMDWRIPFKENQDGSLLVKETDVVEVRSRLSDVGIPYSKSVGLEVFTEGDYGMSEFAQQVNFQRGIEAELARTLRSFDEIKHARVHLTIPKQSIFKNRQEAAKGSVVVHLASPNALSEARIMGIKQLVASSVKGLSPENVTVIGGDGVPLESSEKTAVSGGSIAAFEQDIKLKAVELILGVLPNCQPHVAVRAEVNFDKVKSVKEELIPMKESGKGAPIKTITDYSTPVASGKQSSSTAKTSRTEFHYAYSTKKEETEHQSGVIEKLGIGVVLPSDASDEQIQTIEQVLTVALGIDLERGDKLAVVAGALPSVTEPTQSENPFVAKAYSEMEEADYVKISRNEALKYAAIGALGFIVLWILSLILIHNLAKRNSQPKPLSVKEREETLKELKQWLAAGDLS